MLPTLYGRLQTRIAVLAVVGGLAVLVVTPLLASTVPLPRLYRATFTVLAATIVLGVAWEFLYHLVQQFRWEKDWPTLFGLVTSLNEGLLVWALLALGVVPAGLEIPAGQFVTVFAAAWLSTWLWVNGPMRAPFIRWRFRGGRLV